MLTHRLNVTIHAATKETLEEMIEALARVACDVANSTTDDEAFIEIMDDAAVVDI